MTLTFGIAEIVPEMHGTNSEMRRHSANLPNQPSLYLQKGGAGNPRKTNIKKERETFGQELLE